MAALRSASAALIHVGESSQLDNVNPRVCVCRPMVCSHDKPTKSGACLSNMDARTSAATPRAPFPPPSSRPCPRAHMCVVVRSIDLR